MGSETESARVEAGDERGNQLTLRDAERRRPAQYYLVIAAERLARLRVYLKSVSHASVRRQTSKYHCRQPPLLQQQPIRCLLNLVSESVGLFQHIHDAMLSGIFGRSKGHFPGATLDFSQRRSGHRLRTPYGIRRSKITKFEVIPSTGQPRDVTVGRLSLNDAHAIPAITSEQTLIASTMDQMLVGQIDLLCTFWIKRKGNPSSSEEEPSAAISLSPNRSHTNFQTASASTG